MENKEAQPIRGSKRTGRREVAERTKGRVTRRQKFWQQTKTEIERREKQRKNKAERQIVI